MTWFPMAFLPPQIALASGVGYSGAVLKAYAAETSTVIPMATGKTGVTTATSFVLNAAGYPTYSGNVIIPHVQANYKLCLYPNQAAADANSGAVWSVDDITIAPATNTAFVGEFSGDDSTTVFTLASNLGTDEKTIMVFADQKLEQYAPNTTFTDATALTLGAGWSSAGTLTAAGAISTDAYMTSLLNLVAGESYTATYTVTAFTAGTVTLKIGGVAGTARGATGTFTETIIPQGADQLIKFTGAGFTGSIDNLTVHRTTATHRQILRPEEYTVNGTSLTFNTAPAKGTNNILVFAPSLLFGAVGDLVAAAATSEANALTYETLASQWASQTSGIVAATDFSAKAWTIGGTGLTDGAAKNWAQQTGGDVTGAAALSRSAKSWAQEDLHGATYGGSSKDWAQSASLPDGVSKSAKSYAADGSTSAATATTQAGIATTGGTTATTQAGIATTQAGIATAKAVLTAADVVTTGTNATTATTQAGLATTARTAADADVVLTHADVVLTHADVVLTHADVVSTHADAATTATNATTSTTQAGIASAAAAAATAAAIGLANEWLFASSTVMANPATGNFRLNNAALGSVTQIAISASSGDSGNPNLSGFINTWDDSTHTPRGIIRIEKNATNFLILGVNGALTDNTTWLQIPVTVIASAGSFVAADVTFVGFTPYGNDGTGTGTVTTTGAPANGNLAQFSGGTAITNGDLSGDISTSGSLVTTIGALKVATGMIQANAITTAKITDANVTLAKIANAAANSKLLGSGAAGSGAAYAELTLGTNLSMSGTTLNAAGGATALDGLSDVVYDITTDHNLIIGSNTTPAVGAQRNIVIGEGAFGGVTTNAADDNTIIGYQAGNAITAAVGNTVVGSAAMGNVTGVGQSVAVGYQAMQQAGGSAASQNTAVGYQAMVGSGTVVNNTGTSNVAVGFQALNIYTSDTNNTAIGWGALATQQGSGTGGNVAVGYSAGTSVTSGGRNSLLGQNAGQSIITGTSNVCIGRTADVTASASTNRIAIGDTTNCATDNTAQIGNASLTALTVGTSNTASVKALNTSKMYIKSTGATGARTNAGSFNVTSITDTGAGDFSAVTTTSFADTNYTILFGAELTATTYAVANDRKMYVRNGGQSAGTIRMNCIDSTATTNLVKDPTAWHVAALGKQ